MKTFATAALLFASLFQLSASANTPVELPSNPTGIRVMAADPFCVPGSASSFYVSMDYQTAPYGWLHIGDWKMCVNNGGTSEMLVYFEGEPYHATITIHGQPSTGQAWSYSFSRADYVSEQKIAEPSRVSFSLSPGQSTGFKLSGRYQYQWRNLRFSVKSLGVQGPGPSLQSSADIR